MKSLSLVPAIIQNTSIVEPKCINIDQHCIQNEIWRPSGFIIGLCAPVNFLWNIMCDHEYQCARPSRLWAISFFLYPYMFLQIWNIKGFKSLIKIKTGDIMKMEGCPLVKCILLIAGRILKVFSIA